MPKTRRTLTCITLWAVTLVLLFGGDPVLAQKSAADDPAKDAPVTKATIDPATTTEDPPQDPADDPSQDPMEEDDEEIPDFALSPDAWDLIDNTLGLIGLWLGGAGT